MDERERVGRFLAVSSLAASIYLGYKAISFAERHLRLGDAQARRSVHHRWSAHQIMRAIGLLRGLEKILDSRVDWMRTTLRYANIAALEEPNPLTRKP